MHNAGNNVEVCMGLLICKEFVKLYMIFVVNLVDHCIKFT
jgi:hypothetical protein